MPLHSRYGVLESQKQENENVDESLSGLDQLSRTGQFIPYVMTSLIKKKRMLVVIGDSLFREMESPIC